MLRDTGRLRLVQGTAGLLVVAVVAAIVLVTRALPADLTGVLTGAFLLYAGLALVMGFGIWGVVRAGQLRLEIDGTDVRVVRWFSTAVVARTKVMAVAGGRANLGGLQDVELVLSDGNRLKVPALTESPAKPGSMADLRAALGLGDPGADVGPARDGTDRAGATGLEQPGPAEAEDPATATEG